MYALVRKCAQWCKKRNKARIFKPDDIVLKASSDINACLEIMMVSFYLPLFSSDDDLFEKTFDSDSIFTTYVFARTCYKLGKQKKQN
jgi:hypothetical protein